MIVDDLEVAMRDLTWAAGVIWVTPQQRSLDIVHGGRAKSVELRFTVSVEGPVHLEVTCVGALSTPTHG
jgi:hypothetical protein